MSRSINSDKSWNSTDEEFEDCDNSSSNSINRRISGDDIPGGCITTHSVSSVIRPGSKMPRNDPLQFVKIQHNELSKKAVEQIKIAEEKKITKEKIKEVEEEWQNNLLNWKSKRRQSKSNSEDESTASLATNRKTKTFSEILNEKAKSGHRIGYNLHKYIDGELEKENELRFNFDNNYETNDNEKNSDDSYKSESDSMSGDNKRSPSGDVIVFDTSLLEEFSSNHNRQDSSEDSSIVNINTSVEEVVNNSDKSSNSYSSGDKNQLMTNNHNNNNNNYNEISSKSESDNSYINEHDYRDLNVPKISVTNDKPIGNKIRVEITDWKQNSQRDNVLMYLLKQEEHQRHHQNNDHISDDDIINQQNDSYECEDDEEDDEELERLRLDQEKSFKAKLSAFECLAKQEENMNNHNSNNGRVNGNKFKNREDFKRSVPEVEQLIHSEQQQIQRPLFTGPYDNSNENDSEEVVNARIQQLHIERHRAQHKQTVNTNGQQQNQPQQQSQQPQHQPQQQQSQQPLHQPQQQLVQQSVQSLPPQVYQSSHYSDNVQNPSQHSSQPQRNFDQQQYYLMDEKFVQKQNQTPVKSPKPKRGQPVASPQTQHNQQLSYQQPIQPTEHLYVNQKQLLMSQKPNHSQYYEPIESHERYESPERHFYDNGYEKPPILQQQIPPNVVSVGQQPQHSQQLPKEPIYSSAHNQYLYYPKPYANKPNQQPVPQLQKPVMVGKQQKQIPIQQPRPQTSVKQKPQQLGYNQNHWLLQEAELRRQLASVPTQSSLSSTVSATQRPTTCSDQKPSSVSQKGMLSVSGKKKCSSCGDELGRGCAAMVVESLSLYYHINCFRCSVCNIQLGNGTVGTDVRVRNHKLHCQNCYSNDEAGLKFSRV